MRLPRLFQQLTLQCIHRVPDQALRSYVTTTSLRAGRPDFISARRLLDPLHRIQRIGAIAHHHIPPVASPSPSRSVTPLLARGRC